MTSKPGRGSHKCQYPCCMSSCPPQQHPWGLEKGKAKGRKKVRKMMKERGERKEKGQTVVKKLRLVGVGH